MGQKAQAVKRGMHGRRRLTTRRRSQRLGGGAAGDAGGEVARAGKREDDPMRVYEYTLDAAPAQCASMDEAIRIAQFIRNKSLRVWMDVRGSSANAVQIQCSQLAKDVPFAALLNSQARQASADRAWAAISRFYARCRAKVPGKKGYPRFQHNNRSVEYKRTGWKLEPDGRHLTFTDGCAIGRVRLVGTRAIETFPVERIKRVRLVRLVRRAHV